VVKHRLVAAALGALATLGLVAAPAVAAEAGGPGEVRIQSGHFDWQINFNTRVESRRYGTPNSGRHTLHFEPGINCQTLHEHEYFIVELWADKNGPDRFLRGTDNVSCRFGGDRHFDGISPDPAFYFVVKSSHGSFKPNRIVGGTTFYP
jgi:hypothetical protein